MTELAWRHDRYTGWEASTPDGRYIIQSDPVYKTGTGMRVVEQVRYRALFIQRREPNTNLGRYPTVAEAQQACEAFAGNVTPVTNKN